MEDSVAVKTQLAKTEMSLTLSNKFEIPDNDESDKMNLMLRLVIKLKPNSQGNSYQSRSLIKRDIVVRDIFTCTIRICELFSPALLCV